MKRSHIGTFVVLLMLALGASAQQTSPPPAQKSDSSQKPADAQKTDSQSKDTQKKTEDEFPFPDPYKTDQAPPRSDTQKADPQKESTDEEFPFPDPYKTTEPPRSEPRTGMDSSSKDRDTDITPPAGDNAHPGSPLGGPDPNDTITVMKPWDPHKADKDVEVGIFYFKEGNYRAAESRFREALQWQDNHAEAIYRLGTAVEKEGKLAEARGYYEQYLKLLPAGELAKDAKKALDRINAASDKAENKAPTSRP